MAPPVSRAFFKGAKFTSATEGGSPRVRIKTVNTIFILLGPRDTLGVKQLKIPDLTLLSKQI